jgi:hypothetical protein
MRNGVVKEVPKDFGYYIPFLPQLQQLLNCEDVLYCVKNPRQYREGEFRTVTDGLFFRYHSIVQQNAGIVLAILIYCDDVEFADPCKSKALRHKLRLYYWTLGNIYPELRSSLEAINLLAVVKSDVVKKYGNDPFLEDFVKDMKTLQEGYTFNIKDVNEKLHGLLLCACGDTPASANLGGFKESHFALRPCRHCMVTKSELCHDFVENTSMLRKYEEHNKYLKEIDGFSGKSQTRRVVVQPEVNLARIDEDIMECESAGNYADHHNPSINYGVNGKTILSEAPGFDVTKCLPIDIMHTFHEGVIKLLCRLILKEMCIPPPPDPSTPKKRKKPKVELSYVNDVIQSVCDFGHLNRNRPSIIDKTHLTSGELKQSAAQMFVLVHVLPFIALNNIDEEKQNLLLLLLKIIHIVMSFVITTEDLSKLEQLVNEFGTTFVRLYPNHRTLKLHSLRHLVLMVRLFGSLRQVWCFRFEAMHRQFTAIVDTVNNMKNIALTMACWYINKRDAALLDAKQSGKFLYLGDQYFGCSNSLFSDLPDEDRHLLLNFCEIEESATIKVAKKIKIHSSEWKKDAVVALEKEGEKYQFGLLKKIYIFNEEVFFMYSLLKTEFREKLNAFEITGCEAHGQKCLSLKNISFPHPVITFRFSFPSAVKSYIFMACHESM